MVLKGKGMEASDDTIDVCVKILNSDAAEITTLPDHLKIALD